MELCVSLLLLWQAACAGNGKALESTLIPLTCNECGIAGAGTGAGMATPLPEHLDPSRPNCNRVLQVRGGVGCSQNFGRMKFPLCEHFKSTQGVGSKIPVVIAALKIIPLVQFSV